MASLSGNPCSSLRRALSSDVSDMLCSSILGGDRVQGRFFTMASGQYAALLHGGIILLCDLASSAASLVEWNRGWVGCSWRLGLCHVRSKSGWTWGKPTPHQP